MFHKFIVSIYYANIKSERLLYIHFNQLKLRIEEYILLRNAAENDGNAENLGALVILPAIFTSTLSNHKYTQDAMIYLS